MTAIGRDIAGLNLLSEASEVVLKLTPLFAGSAITHWYKSASLLEKECPAFLTSAPTLLSIRITSFR